MLGDIVSSIDQLVLVATADSFNGSITYLLNIVAMKKSVWDGSGDTGVDGLRDEVEELCSSLPNGRFSVAALTPDKGPHTHPSTEYSRDFFSASIYQLHSTQTLSYNHSFYIHCLTHLWDNAIIIFTHKMLTKLSLVHVYNNFCFPSTEHRQSTHHSKSRLRSKNL